MLSLWDTHYSSYFLLRYSLSASFTFYSVNVCFLVFPKMHSFPFLWLYSFNKHWVSAHCGGSAGKEFACSVGDLGSISGLGRSPGEGANHAAQQARITWLSMHWSRGWSYTAHVTDHALMLLTVPLRFRWMAGILRFHLRAGFHLWRQLTRMELWRV